MCICEQLRKSRGTRQKISKRKHVSTCSKQFDWVEKLHDQLWIQKGILISKEKLCDWLKTQAMAYKNKEQYDFFFYDFVIKLDLNVNSDEKQISAQLNESLKETPLSYTNIVLNLTRNF